MSLSCFLKCEIDKQSSMMGYTKNEMRHNKGVQANSKTFLRGEWWVKINAFEQGEKGQAKSF